MLPEFSCALLMEVNCNNFYIESSSTFYIFCCLVWPLDFKAGCTSRGNKA